MKYKVSITTQLANGTTLVQEVSMKTGIYTDGEVARMLGKHLVEFSAVLPSVIKESTKEQED